MVGEGVGSPRAICHFGLYPNLLKIHRRTGKLSYLVYPDFDTDPHLSLLRCVKLNLRTRQLECYDYAESKNPPVLHRKETFLSPEDERHAKFARLTAQEEKAGCWRMRLASEHGMGGTGG